MQDNAQQEQTKSNFFHKTTNISDWMRDQIKGFVKERGYEVVHYDIRADIMTRMSKITVVNTVDVKMKGKNEEIVSLDGYASINKEYDDLGLKWLVDFIKEKEREALLKFSGEVQEEKHKVPTKVEVVGEKRRGEVSIELCFSSTVEDMGSFLVEPRFYAIWMGPTLESKEGRLEFEGIVVKELRRKGNVVEMEYRWKDWEEYTKVIINLERMGDNVKLSLKQRGVPVEYVENVKGHWLGRVFPAISASFRCAIKAM